MNENEKADPAKPRRWGLWLGAAAVAGAIAGVAAIYGMDMASGNRESASCPGSAAVAARIDPLARGEVAALSVSAAPQPMGPISFLKPDGTPTSLAEFRGRTVLLNLWAIWCGPCRKEMPALDTLQRDLGSKDFEVVAVNIDTRNPERIGAFLEETGVRSLARYADPTTGILQALKNEGLTLGLPTTVLIDGNGCRLGVMAGAAEWASEDARKLIGAALGI